MYPSLQVLRILARALFITSLILTTDAIGIPTAQLQARQEQGDLSEVVIATAVMLAVSLVLGIAMNISLCDCNKKASRQSKQQPMAAQVMAPLDLSVKRPRFEYVEYRTELQMLDKLPPSSIDMYLEQSTEAAQRSVDDGSDLHRPQDHGYLDVGMEEEPLDNEPAILPMRRSSSVLQAFADVSPYMEVASISTSKYTEVQATDADRTSSTMHTKAFETPAYIEDQTTQGEEYGFGDVTRSNPLAAEEVDFTGFGNALDATEEAGFGFDVDFDATSMDDTVAGVTDDEANNQDMSEQENFGFGPPPGDLPEGTMERIDVNLDVLNTKMSSIEERLSAIDDICEILKLDGGPREVYEMNGTISLASVIKEELDVEIQEKALLALNVISEIPDGLAEVVQAGIVPIWSGALEHDELYAAALGGLDVATRKQNEIAIQSMLGTNVISKLAGRITDLDDDQTTIALNILVVCAQHAGRFENVKDIFEGFSKVLDKNPAVINKTRKSIEFLVTTFGEQAAKAAENSGLTTALLSDVQP